MCSDILRKMIPYTKAIKILLICLLVLFGMDRRPSLSDDAVILVSNPSVSIDRISRQDIQQIFMGEKVKWSDTQQIKLCILTSKKPLALFLKSYLELNSLKYKRHWRRILFTGTGAFPKFFKDEKSLIEYVAKTDGAIGFVLNLPPNSQVKTITPY